MGRQKLVIRKLEANSKRQHTFSQRRTGLIKKAKDLSILCDVDILLVVFSSMGKPFLGLGKNSIFEAVIRRYADIAAQERNSRRVETLKELRVRCKKADHEINFEELVNQGSQLIEEEQLFAYTGEINKAVNLLGSLIDIPNINKIEDVNVLENMEKGLVDLLNRIRIEKENNLDNYSAGYGMNQFCQQKEEPSPFTYSMNDGQQVVPPHNPMFPQCKDITEFNSVYNVQVNDSTQDITWAQMDGIQHTVTDQPVDSIPLMDPSISMESDKMDNILQNMGGINKNGNENGNTNNIFKCQEDWFNEMEFLTRLADPAVSMESNKIDNILQNKGGINGNGNRNGNTDNNFTYQEEWFDEKGFLDEPADLHLPESLKNGSNDFIGILFEQDVFFKEKNADQGDGAAAHDTNFQNWIFKPSDF